MQSGNLTPDQHVTLVKQLEQLYKLQKLKDEEGSNDSLQPTKRPPSSTHTDTKTHQAKDEQQSVEQSSEQETSRPDGTKTFSRKEFISLSDSKSDSVFFVDKSGVDDNLNNHFGPTHRGGRPPHGFRGRPSHPNSFERFPQDRYYAGPPRGGGGGHFRGDQRPPYRSRSGRPFYPRRSRGGHDRYLVGSEAPPPPMGPGRGSGRILRGQPPPPHWHEPPRQGLIL